MSASPERGSVRLGQRWDQTGKAGRQGTLLLIGAVLVLAVAAPLMARLRPPVPQPVAFNHRHHTETLQLGCDFCHTRVNEGAHAGLPDARICSMCHSVPAGESEEALRVTELIGAGDPLYFNKLFTLPDHVFYTHRRHVLLGELECTNCHGDIASSEQPPERPLVRITMDFCIDCHEDRDVTTDCAACHR